MSQQVATLKIAEGFDTMATYRASEPQAAGSSCFLE